MRSTGRTLSAGLIVAAAVLAGPPLVRAAADRLASSEGGAGSPALVLIHGIGSDRRVWDQVATNLERGHRVIRVDLPGHGATPPDPKVALRAIARRLDGTLKELRVEDAVLVGHSYGALVALEFAAERPKRVRGIVTIDMATHLEADSAQIANLERILAERPRAFVDLMFRTLTRRPEMADSLVNDALRVDLDVIQGYFHDVWHADLRARIKGIRAPIQFIGTDAIWPEAESWTSARRRLGYETEGPAVGRRIPGAGHFIPVDAPDSLAQAIRAFAATIRR